MALQVWLPLNGDLHNQGLEQKALFTSSTTTINNNGKIGKCYNFTQNTGNGIYLSSGISCADFMNNYINNHSWTLCAWIKTSSTSTTPLICLTYGLRFFVGVSTSISLYNSSRTVSCSANIATNGGVWHHVAASYNVNTNIISIYVDGILKNITNYTSGYTYASSWTNGIFIGRDPNNSTANDSYFYKGNINDVRIYDHCLSPKEIKEISKGLILHYKLDDHYLESTTNLITTSDCLSSTCYNGAISKYSYGTTTDMYKTTGTFEGKFCTKVYMGTSGNNAYPYVYVNNLYVSNGTNSPEYKTLSFDFFGTIANGNCLIPYKLGNGSATCYWTNNVTSNKSGTFTNSGQIPIVVGIWNHITMTLHGTTNDDAQWGYIRIGNSSHTSNTSNYWLFANMQLELKDHATPYVGINGTRSNSIIYDCSGYGNNGSILESLNLNNDKPRYNYSTNFDGNTSGILIENLNISNIINTAMTYSFWIKPNGENGARSVYFGSYSGSSFSIEKTTGNKLRLYWNGSPDLTSNLTITDGQWQHIVITKNGTSEIKVYLNGSLVQTLSNTYNNVTFPTTFRIGRDTRTGTTSYKGLMSDFRIYSTVLSANDILELYNNPANIDNQGDMFSFEFDEENTSKQQILQTGITKIDNYIEINDKIKVLSDGSVFLQILHHNNPTSNLFTVSNCWLNNTTNLYSATILLKTIFKNLTEYEFLVCEKLTSSSSESQVRWKQTSNPALSSTLSGYTLISGSTTSNGGLMNKGTYGCFHNGNTWWNCCGSYTAYSGGIPGFTGIVKSGYLDLYIRIPEDVLKGNIEDFLKFFKKSILSTQFLEK